MVENDFNTKTKEESVHTGYFISDEHIWGPKSSGLFWIEDGLIRGPVNSGKYRIENIVENEDSIESAQFFGPNCDGEFYVENRHIYGLEKTPPLDERRLILFVGIAGQSSST